MKIYLSPPFGNYIKLYKFILPKNIIPIIGSYTLFPRDGLYSQVFKTLRYKSDLNGWVNSIGLRNNGIFKGISHYNNILQYNKEAILSIGIINLEDIKLFNTFIPMDTNLELNISCPNISKITIPELIEADLNSFLSTNRNQTIIKLPHNVSMKDIDRLYDVGFRKFHCSNTKQTKYGGLSGKNLLNTNLKTIHEMNERYYGDLEIIGGGGIMSNKDIEKYINAGADHVSISSVCFNPRTAMKLSI